MFKILGIMEWGFDVSIIEFLNQLIQVGTPGHEFFKTLFKLITQLGTETVFIVIFALTYFGIDKKLGKEVGVASFFAMVFNNAIKGFFNRLRPFQQSPNSIELGDTSICEELEIDSTLPKSNRSFVTGEILDGNYYQTMTNSNGETCYYATSSSFPSGHSNGSSSFYNSYALNLKKSWAWILSSCLCALVMVSRMVLGAHFLTDVLAGYLTGMIFILFVYFLKKYTKNEYKLYFGLVIVFGIVTFLSPFYSATPKDLFSTYGVASGLVFGMYFEEKKVNFTMTKTWWKALLRIIGGIIIAVGIKILFKLPYSSMVDKGVLPHLTYIFDFIRYGFMTFACVGLYPMLFKKVKFLHD